MPWISRDGISKCIVRYKSNSIGYRLANAFLLCHALGISVGSNALIGTTGPENWHRDTRHRSHGPAGEVDVMIGSHIDAS